MSGCPIYRCLRRIAVVASLVSLSTITHSNASTALTGSTGLIYVPVADVVRSDHFAFGGMIADAQAFPGKSFSHFAEDNPADFYFAGYLTIGYIPRLEITVRGNGMPGTVGPSTDVGPFYTDGMFSAQLLAWRGSEYIPSIAFGLQDIYGFMIFNAAYGVATWCIPQSHSQPISVTVGWAVDWYDKNIGTSDTDFVPNHIMNGVFVGVEYPVHHWVSALIEYDSRSTNLGLRFEPASWVRIDVAAVRWGLSELARRRIQGFSAQLCFVGKL